MCYLLILGQTNCICPWLSHGFQSEKVGTYEAPQCSTGVYFWQRVSEISPCLSGMAEPLSEQYDSVFSVESHSVYSCF